MGLLYLIGRFCILFRAESLHITPPSWCDFHENRSSEIRTSATGAHVASSIAKPYGYSHTHNAAVRSCTGHVARMAEDRGVQRVLVGKPEGKRPLGRPRRRWEDNIKMDLQEVGGCRGDWMELAQDRDSWRALVGTVRDFRVP